VVVAVLPPSATAVQSFPPPCLFVVSSLAVEAKTNIIEEKEAAEPYGNGRAPPQNEMNDMPKTLG